MLTISDLLLLPLSTLIVLATGYVAYRIAYIGHDGAHSTVDVVFLSFTFSALASAVLWVCGDWFWPGVFLSICMTLGAAAFWRVFLSPFIWKKLRVWGISDHDRGRSAWESMITRGLLAPNRIVITLTNGRQLMCDDTRPFDDAPLGPCLFGPDGSVALYVTSERPDSDSDWKARTPFDADNAAWGYEITVVPASEISRVAITRPA